MFTNPIIRRYRFSQLRPQQVWVFGSLYLCIALLVVILNYAIYRFAESGYDSQEQLLFGLATQFGLIELFMLWLLTPACTANVVTRDMADKSFDFFRMLPLSASQKAVGIVVGRNQLTLLIAAVNLVPCLVIGILLELPASFLCQLMVFVFATALAANLLALLFSILSFRKTRTASPAVLMVAGFFMLMPFAGILADSSHGRRLDTVTASFFAIDVPLFLLLSFVALFVAVWAYLGILRRFTREYESLFSRFGAQMFVLTLIPVIYGMFYAYLDQEGHPPYVYVFWIVSLIPVWVVPACSLYSFDKYLEMTRASRKGDGLFKRLLASSNVVGGLPLFAIWLAFAVAALVGSEASPLALLSLASLTFSSFLVILALLETYVTWKPRNEKVGYLVGFAAIIYFALPLILSGILDQRGLHLFSPIGAMSIMDPDYAMVIQWPPILANMLWLALLGVLICKRYRALVLTRSTMESQRDAA